MALVRNTVAGKMKRPDPQVRGGKWVVDLRAWNHGQRYTLGPDTLSREDALHLAYGALATLQGERMAEAATERDLFSERAPTLFAAALDAWQQQKTYDGKDSERYGAEHTRLVRRELGAYKLADFSPPGGHARLLAYVRELERRGLSGRTLRNRFSILGQVLRFSVERGWLDQPPMMPRMPPKAGPVYRWISEVMFRALREELYKDVPLWRMTGRRGEAGVVDEQTYAVFIARRRVYLSWLFYTGVHLRDADTASADQLFLDGHAYIRHNNKSRKSVPDEQFEMPEPLYRDLVELTEILGRPFYPGELFTGGPWRHAARQMGAAAKRLAFPDTVTAVILRRSFAREMFLHGYSVRQVADRMGHTNERMLNEIYVRTPRPEGHQKTRWVVTKTPHLPGPPNGLARVFSLKGGAK